MEPLESGDPRTVGPYVLIARLGSGGMGQVFLGRTRGGRTVAVKVVKAELATDPEFRRRFRHEVAAARLVSGRYTAAVVDADPEAATPWLATAYVSGLTLRAVVGGGAVVSGGARLPETSLRVLAYGLARALAEIHTAGVVHRDLKPSNVMLAVDGPHVIDFGISRVMAATDFTRTDVGTIIGSPGFMSPEQTRGQALTGATDVFSLGTVLAYAATGQNPFGGGPDHALLYRIAHGEPDLSGVPDSLAPLIAMCLAKDPAQRPSTAQIIGRMADTPGGAAWLPAELTAAIAQSAAEILDYEGIAVFPQPDADSLTMAIPRSVPAPDPTLVMPATGDRPTTFYGRTGERTQERIAVGEPPEAKRGVGGAGVVAGLLSVAVIAALATALVLVLRSGGSNPGSPPAASVGTSTSQTPLTRSVSATSSAQTSTTPPTSSSPPQPTTPASTTSTSSAPSPTTSSTVSTTQSTSQPTTPSSSSASSSTPPSSSPSTTHSSTPPTTPSSSHS